MKRKDNVFLLGSGFAVLWLMAAFLWRFAPPLASGRKERPVLLYQDSMHPWVKPDRPGKCPVCGMDLTPIYEPATGVGPRTPLVELSSGPVTVLHVQTQDVKRQALCRTLRVAGTLEASEERQAILSAPGPGRVEALAVPFPGTEVKEGQPLMTFFSPEWAQTRRYLLRAAALTQPGSNNIMLPVKTKAEPFSAELVAPLSGTVIERAVFAGQSVAEGAKLLVLADLSRLLFRFDIYEQQSPWIEVGQSVEVEPQAVPGQLFRARVSLIEPAFDNATRTVKVRAEVGNPLLPTGQRRLRPGMYAEGRVRVRVPDVVAIPRSAVLFTGASACAYVEQGDGVYERRCVRLGRQGDELWEVLEGLNEGERVVTCGNVLIDAQAELNPRGAPDRPQAEMAGDTYATHEALAGDRPAVP